MSFNLASCMIVLLMLGISFFVSMIAFYNIKLLISVKKHVKLAAGATFLVTTPYTEGKVSIFVWNAVQNWFEVYTADKGATRNHEVYIEECEGSYVNMICRYKSRTSKEMRLGESVTYRVEKVPGNEKALILRYERDNSVYRVMYQLGVIAEQYLRLDGKKQSIYYNADKMFRVFTAQVTNQMLVRLKKEDWPEMLQKVYKVLMQNFDPTDG